MADGLWQRDGEVTMNILLNMHLFSIYVLLFVIFCGLLIFIYILLTQHKLRNARIKYLEKKVRS